MCAIGGNARDYGTLLEAARLTPQIRFVCVVRPNSLRSLDIPSNVTVHTNLPSGQAMNILLHSRFMVLPLLHSEVPCGHVTIVAAMHLGKAFVITDSEGVRDYVQDGHNAMTIPARSAAALAEATERLWRSPVSAGVSVKTDDASPDAVHAGASRLSTSATGSPRKHYGYLRVPARRDPGETLTSVKAAAGSEQCRGVMQMKKDPLREQIASVLGSQRPELQWTRVCRAMGQREYTFCLII